MKKIKVIVKDKTILELAEDAKKGDLIDLSEITEVDDSYLEEIIDSGRDRVYQAKLQEFKKTLDAQNQVKITEITKEKENLKIEYDSKLKLQQQELKNGFDEELNKANNQITDYINQINNLKKDYDKSLILQEQEVRKQCEAKINDLSNQIVVLNKTKESEMAALKAKNASEVSKIKSDEELKYNSLLEENKHLKNSREIELENQKLTLQTAFNDEKTKLEMNYKDELAKKDSDINTLKKDFELEKNKALQEQKDILNEKIKEKEEIINNLQRSKANMNVKQTGEDLEAWCDGEITSYMQNGLFNCTWIKDNKVVKEEGETKGSKADYIFKVYASKNHNENELLASVCLDMKDENPDSVNKKTNADYYKQLDKNREKKDCRYAVLVSNLELDKPNISPIFKVREYEDMYVVRPAYMMTFLNMIASLSTHCSDILLSNEKNILEFKTKQDIKDLFENIKATYLDKPLDTLQKSVEDILKNSDAIKTAANKIDEQCDKVKRNYISQIVNKIGKFELSLDKKIIKNLD